tara:strand:+ start:2287 stop:2661 length:375 start_codon:yes stop_codon:yes gene_type:complete
MEVMKKLLALLLLSPFVVSEEVEYPIELTCEAGANIYYINFDKNSESWIKRISGTEKIVRADKGNKIVIKEFTVSDAEIAVIQISTKAGMRISINRYSGGFYFSQLPGPGQCFKGFKEYTEKQI